MDNSFILNVIAKLNKQLSKSSINGDLKSLNDKMFVRVVAKLSKTLSSMELKKQLRELNDFYINVGTKLTSNNQTKQKLQQNIKALQQSISDLEIGLKTSKFESDIKFVRNRASKKFQNIPIDFNLEIKKEKAISDIEYIGKKYSRLFSSMSASKKYENILSSAYSISDANDLKNVRDQIQSFTSELKANGLAAQSTGDKWRKLIDRSKELFSATAVIRTIFTHVKQSVSTFLQLDTAMTNLYKVQNQITSRDQFSGLLTTWNKLAQELKVSTESLINSAAEWSKIGFDLDKSEELAKVTTIFEKTAEISNEKANSTLVSAAQAFTEIGDLGEDDYVERVTAIGDRINAIGNKYSISSEGIADALQNSAAALKMANNDLDESIAIVTTANKIFQDPNEVGNMAKILSARLRGQKGELEALGEDTEGMIESVSKIQTQILNLTHNKVNIFEDDNETLKSTYDIVSEIGKVYGSLSDKDQASLLEIIGGKQRMSTVASLLLNYKELEKVKKDSMNSDNSMQDEYNKYLESAEASIVSFKEKLVETYSTFMSGDLIKHTADIGGAILDIINKFDLLKHTLVAIATIKIGQGIGTLGGIISSTVKQVNTLGSALQKVKELPLDKVLRKDALKQIGEGTQNLTEKNLKLLLSQKQLKDSDQIAILISQEMTKKQAKEKLEQMGLTQATNANTAANNVNAGSVTTLKGAFTGLKASIKATWAAMSTLQKAGLIFAAISTVYSIISSVVDSSNQKQEEARQKAIETANASNEEAKNLQELYVKYQQLASIQDRTESQESEYKNALEEVTKALGDKANALKTLKEGTEEYNNVLDDLTKKEFKEAWGDAKAGRKAAADNLMDTDINGFDLFGLDNKTPYGFQKNILTQWGDGKENEKAVEIIAKILDKYKKEYNNGKDIVFGANPDWSLDRPTNEEDVVEFYLALGDALDNLKQYEDMDLTHTTAYEELEEMYSGVSDSLEEYTKQQYEMLKNEYLYKNDMPKTTEEFEKMKESILKNSGASEEYQAVLEDMIDTDFSDLINGLEEAERKKEELGNTQPPSFTDILSQIQSLSEGLGQLDKIYADVYDKKDFDWSSILNNKDFKEKFGSLDRASGQLGNAYNEFMETVSNSPDDIAACQESFDNLTTAYIIHSGKLKDITPETQAVTAAMLKQMGVSNALQMTTARLSAEESYNAAVKDDVKLSSENLENATWSDINTILELGYASKESSFYLANLALSKIDLDSINLNESGSIDQICNIAAAAGSSAEYVDALRTALNKLHTASSNSLKYKKIELLKEEKREFLSDGDTELAKEVDAQIAALENPESLKTNVSDILAQIREDIKSNAPNASDFYADYTGSDATESAKEAAEKAAKDTAQTYDWIETAVSRIESLISRLKVKADSAYSSWTSRNRNLREEISAVRSEIELQQRAYERYMQQAASVGLSEAWAEKVRNGQVDIGSVSDENLSNKIKEYQEWYEKALECKNAVSELNETVSELYKSAFDNVSSQYDTILSAIEHQKSMLNEYISQSEQNDYSAFDKNHSSLVKSIGLYRNLIVQEQQNISRLEQEKAALLSAFHDAMNNGNITEGSDAWAQMRDKINEVTLAIASANTEILNYHNSIGESFEAAFDNVSRQYDNILNGLEHRKDMLDAAISQTEEKGWLVSIEYYKALMKTESNTLSQMQKKRESLNSALISAVNSGEIKEYSQAWYDMRKQIDDVSQAIREADTAMIQYGNSIREIEWQIFDLLQERISGITSEAEFILNLFDDDKLYNDDNGQLTDKGMAAMGLHGMNYNVYMAQSEQYAQEIQEIDKQLADDPYNQTLAERRQELLELQQEMILAAEEEKQAIKDMVEEGINKELEALKELIDTYTEALDSQKDMYDYQQKVSEKSKEIASLQKQLSAYEGDLSEEARAKIQQIKVSLEEAEDDLKETEYEKYIADQKQILDDLYNTYELILNQRLDNVDLLIADMIDKINSNSSDINTTIQNEVSSVGATLSDAMRNIWNADGRITQVLTTYGENMQNGILSAATTVNNTLNGINQNIQSMISQLDAIAKTNTKSVDTNTNVAGSSISGGSGNGSKSSGSSSSGTASTNGTTGSSGSTGGSSWGSWFIHKKDSYDKSNLNIEHSIVDRLKYLDFDSSKSARGKYYSAMGFTGRYTGSASQNIEMLKQMKKHKGFSQGGFVADLQKITYQNGDDMVTLNTLKRGEAVLTPNQSELFKRFVENLDKANFELDLPNYLSDLRGLSPANVNRGTVNNNIDMSITLPNVKNYEEFKYALQHDCNFERMVQSMTLGRATGGSSLKKYRC